MTKTNNHMKKGLILGIILLMMVIPFVSAKIQFYQYKTLRGSQTIQNYSYITTNAFIDYDKNAEDVADYIKKGNPLEFYVEYRYFLNSWNSVDNSSKDVDYCNITAILLPQNPSLNSIIFQRTIYPNETDSDVESNKYFFQIQDGEAVRIEANCKFNQTQSLNPIYDLDMPFDFQIVEPTWECKSCQYFNWAKQQVSISKASTLDTQTSSNIHYIWRLFSINLEIIAILFWIFIFITFYIALSLLFMGVYWAYSWLRRWSR
jgi:hypothetical protein